MGSIAPEGLEHTGKHLIRWILKVSPTKKDGFISLNVDGKTIKTLKVNASPHPIYIETSHTMDVQAYPKLEIDSEGVDVVALTQFKELEVSAEQIAKPAPVKVVVSKPTARSPKKTRAMAARQHRKPRTFKPIQMISPGDQDEEKDEDLSQPVLSRTVSQRNGRVSPKHAAARSRSKAMGADQLGGFVKVRRSTPK
ncbi:MAG: hypothetical protein ACXAEN_25235 [Candidatus Thorarchaeota archaeon]|jgi:hypothetical protein